MGVSTLFIGLGGQGGKIVERIANKATLANAEDVEFVVMDTDINDLRHLHRNNPRISTVQTSYRATVGAALDVNQEARDRWFPVSPGLLGKSLTEGAGQVRSISRLAFDHAVENGKMRPLEKSIERLRSLRGDPYEQSLRIMICASLVGGTGSGIALAVAMYIRNFLLTRYQDQSTIIRGFFLEPDAFFGAITDEEERNNLRCNAYAFVREIDAFLRKQYLQDSESEYRNVVFNAPQPGSGRRMDYPNILPYDYIFLMDSMNMDGEHLAELDDYLDHMADIIFTQSIGTASSKSNSVEDNFTRRLDRSKGRARYCGAGCSHLVYPYEDIRRYFGLSWSSSAITGEWLEIDHAFQQEVREGVSDGSALERAKSYVETFDLLRKQNKFFATIGKESRMIEKTTSESGAPIEREVAIGKKYASKLMSFASSWNGSQNGLQASCGPLEAFVEMSEDMEEPLSEKADIQNFASRMKDTWMYSFERISGEYDRANNRYFHLVSTEISESARLYARRLFRIQESETNPLEMLREPHYIEAYLSKDEGRGAKHPIVVRYILNDTLIALTETLEGVQKELNGKENALSNTYESPDSENDLTIRRDKPDSISGVIAQKLREFKDRTPATDEQLGSAADIGTTLLDRRSDIEALRLLTVQQEIISAALEHVAALSRSYLGFFNYMEGQIPNLKDGMKAIEEDQRFNTRTGDPTLYVCASKQCLHTMLEACPQAGSSADLPAELCADIYRGVLRYSLLSHAKQSYSERNKAGELAFADLFKRTVVDYWTTRLEDPALGYQSIVDKSILRAIIDEKRYMDPAHSNDPATGNDVLRGHLLDVLDEAYDLAKPYIMKPLEPEGEEKPSNAGTCIYDRSILEGLGAFGVTAKNHLSALKGVEANEGELSAHELLFYRSVYGFRAAHLPHYSSEHIGKERRPEGEYHRAYWDIAGSLSPDPSRNSYITPHIDRHWHLISYLPDISDENQKFLYNRIIRAFVYGLAYRQFRMTVTRDDPMSFSLKTEAGQRQVSLAVPGRDRCDRFYEVFEALLYDPQVVSQIIIRAEASLNDELSRLSSPRMEDSRLVHMLDSGIATGSFASDDSILGRVNELMANDKALLGEEAFDEITRVNYLAGRIVNHFVRSYDSDIRLEKIRHSLFEIPLYYQISLPPTELRSAEIENMIDGIYDCIRAYLANFTTEDGIDSVCARFFEEQYRRFEYNLPLIDRAFPGAGNSLAAQTTRDKLLSFGCFDRFGSEGIMLSGLVETLLTKWSDITKRKSECLRKNRAQKHDEDDE